MVIKAKLGLFLLATFWSPLASAGFGVGLTVTSQDVLLSRNRSQQINTDKISGLETRREKIFFGEGISGLLVYDSNFNIPLGFRVGLGWGNTTFSIVEGKKLSIWDIRGITHWRGPPI